MTNNNTKIINLRNNLILYFNSKSINVKFEIKNNIFFNYKYFYFAFLFINVLFLMNINELYTQNNQTRNNYYINGEVSSENMNIWIGDIKTNNGTAFGYEILRNVVTYCQRRGFYRSTN
jgi:hypothetical protein